MLGVFKRRVNKNSVEAYKAIKPTVSVRQENVLKAIYELGPCYYREISRRLRTIDGSVTPRIAELKRKKLIEVAYVKVSPLKHRVSYYRATGRGVRHLLNKMEELR